MRQAFVVRLVMLASCVLIASCGDSSKKPPTTGDCINADGTFKAATEVCRAAAGPCEEAATCTGSSADCPANGFKPNTVVCGTATGPCDEAATCTGSSADCPANGFKPNTVVCGTATGPCDEAATCTGSSADCPANGFKSNTVVCGTATGSCDEAATCTGSSADCPANGFKSNTVVCGTATGLCEKAATCTGSSATCPANQPQPDTYVCHEPAGPWDVTVRCSGTAFTCDRPVMEFDWTPHLLPTAPPHSFVDTATTTAHLIWDGSSWQDTKGLIAPVAMGTLPSSESIALWTPAQPRVGPWPSASPDVLRFEANQAHGGNAVDTSGDFTVCVKFKPGIHPDSADPKVLVAKGRWEGASNDGWVLMQRHKSFVFGYRIKSKAQIVYVDLGSQSQPNPENWTYAYLCGGRSGGTLLSSAHGYTQGASSGDDVTGEYFADAASLPLVIGSTPDDTERALDEKIYEIIFDSRPATLATMKDIIGDAEQRKLSHGGAFYMPAFANGTSYDVGGTTYTLPPYATVPFPAYSLGDLLAAGSVPQYNQIIATDTSTSGFCYGAEVVADAAWSNVEGGIAGYDAENGVDLDISNLVITSDDHLCLSAGTNSDFEISCADMPTGAGWDSGSRHKFMACVQASSNPAQRFLQVYADNTTPVLSGTTSAPTVPNLARVKGSLVIGANFDTSAPLTNGRVARVFACPTSDPALCF